MSDFWGSHRGHYKRYALYFLFHKMVHSFQRTLNPSGHNRCTRMYFKLVPLCSAASHSFSPPPSEVSLQREKMRVAVELPATVAVEEHATTLPVVVGVSVARPIIERVRPREEVVQPSLHPPQCRLWPEDRFSTWPSFPRPTKRCTRGLF